jgi:hypothetical protein
MISIFSMLMSFTMVAPFMFMAVKAFSAFMMWEVTMSVGINPETTIPIAVPAISEVNNHTWFWFNPGIGVN